METGNRPVPGLRLPQIDRMGAARATRWRAGTAASRCPRSTAPACGGCWRRPNGCSGRTARKFLHCWRCRSNRRQHSRRQCDATRWSTLWTVATTDACTLVQRCAPDGTPLPLVERDFHIATLCAPSFAMVLSWLQICQTGGESTRKGWCCFGTGPAFPDRRRTKRLGRPQPWTHRLTRPRRPRGSSRLAVVGAPAALRLVAAGSVRGCAGRPARGRTQRTGRRRCSAVAGPERPHTGGHGRAGAPPGAGPWRRPFVAGSVLQLIRSRRPSPGRRHPGTIPALLTMLAAAGFESTGCYRRHLNCAAGGRAEAVPGYTGAVRPWTGVRVTALTLAILVGGLPDTAAPPSTKPIARGAPTASRSVAVVLPPASTIPGPPCRRLVGSVPLGQFCSGVRRCR